MTRATSSPERSVHVIRSKWRTLLKAAHSEAAVLVLVRSFFAAWSPDEIACIPADVARRRRLTARELPAALTTIVEAHAAFRGTARELALMQELLLFMTQAAVRLVQLRALALDGSMGERQVATEPEEGIGGPVPSPAISRQEREADGD